MNKKAALIHWVIFGILAAIAVFMMLTFGQESEEVRGERALHVQRLELEKELFKVELKNRLLVNSQEVIPCLTSSFGEKSECDDIFYYFPKTDFNLKEIKEKYKDSLKKKVNVEDYFKGEEGIQFSVDDNFDYDLFLNGSDLVLIPNKEVSLSYVIGHVITEVVNYKFYPSLSVDIGYDFNEFEEMWIKGNEMWECVENHEGSISQLVSTERKEEQVRKSIIRSCYKTRISKDKKCQEKDDKIICDNWEMRFDESRYFFSINKRLNFKNINYNFYIPFSFYTQEKSIS